MLYEVITGLGFTVSGEECTKTVATQPADQRFVSQIGFVITSYSIHYTKLYDTALDIKITHHGTGDDRAVLAVETMHNEAAYADIDHRNRDNGLVIADRNNFV